MNTLIQTFKHLAGTRVATRRVGSGPEIYVGLETRQVPSEYYWDGMKRSSDAAHPIVVFQYTLSGWGCYSETTVRRMDPGMAFAAIVPSRHCYYLPEKSPRWTFFWLLLTHPYIVGRMIETKKKFGAVSTLSPDSMLIAKSIEFFAGVCRDTFRDRWDQERVQYEFLIEYERHLHQKLHPQPVREKLLEKTQAYVMKHLGRPISILELAALKGMSR